MFLWWLLLNVSCSQYNLWILQYFVFDNEIARYKQTNKKIPDSIWPKKKLLNIMPKYKKNY